MAARGNPHSEPPLHVAPAITPTLTYGRAQPRRMQWRHGAWLVLLIACAAGSWVVGRTARATAQRVVYERQAALHVEPAEDVIFEGDLTQAAKLITAGGHERMVANGLAIDPDLVPAVRAEPEGYTEFVAHLAADSEQPSEYGVLLFLHELTTPGGAKRIVAVRFLPWVVEEQASWHPAGSAGLVAQVFEPGGWLSKPRHVGSSEAPLLLPQVPNAGGWSQVGYLSAQSPNPCLGEVSPLMQQVFNPYDLVTEARLRWYAGQPDVTDPGHFTVDFEIHGQRGTVDGYLSADGSAVHMSVRPSIDPGMPTNTPGATLSR